MAEQINPDRDLSLVVITLCKGVVYGDENPDLWQKLLNLQASVRDYVRVMGLELVIHEDENFAWLKKIESGEEEGDLPTLIVRRQLSYPVSLLLALLRKRLAEHDTTSGERRLILDRQEILDLMKTFLTRGTNEARITDQIDSYINKAVDLGFVRRLKNESGKFEVRRILKAFVDAQWLGEMEKKLKEYAANGLQSGERQEEDG
ncbi:MAG: DUF4194 domain-containing protein [Spirochaetales bacterium]|nr:DUF4194 domain-containing protein [Spirochaetales bacterium]